MAIEKWFERAFAEKPDAALAPNILERLRGTPVRLRQRLQSLSKSCLTFREGESWTVQENAGHLGDLEPLWKTRHDEILAGAEEMSPADLSNLVTWEANHNRAPLSDLLDRFQQLRQQWVDALEQLSRPDFEKSALHPRLKTPMRLIDLCLFVAEHDDHHLARISELIKRL